MRFFKVVFILIFLTTYLNQGFSNDTLRIVAYPKHLHVFAKLNAPFSQIEIKNTEINKTIQLQPNSGANFKIGFYYSWLGFAYSFLLPSNKLLNDKFGKTSGFALDGHLMKTRIMLDVNYKHYTGYYLSNPGQVVDGWDKTLPNPQMPDLSTSILSASFAYVFHPERFSPKAAFAYTRSMRRSGGSWAIGGFASVSSIISDSCIISNAIKQHVDPKLELKELSFSDLGVSFGYSYLLTILKKNFISASLMPGFSYQHVVQLSSVDASIKKLDALSVKSIMHISLGHNGEKYYWGMALYIESSLLKNLNTEVNLGSGFGEFFFGYRFNTENWHFMKKVDQVLHPPFLRLITGKAPVRE